MRALPGGIISPGFLLPRKESDMKRLDKLTKHDAATLEAAGMGIGIMLGLSLSAFVVAVIVYIETYHLLPPLFP